MKTALQGSYATNRDKEDRLLMYFGLSNFEINMTRTSYRVITMKSRDKDLIDITMKSGVKEIYGKNFIVGILEWIVEESLFDHDKLTIIV